MYRQAHFVLATFSLALGSFFVNYHLSQELTLLEYGKFSLVYATLGLVVPFMLFGQATSVTSAYFSDEKNGCNNISHEMLASYKIMALSLVATSSVILCIWYFFYVVHYTIYFVILFLAATFFSSMRIYYLNILVIFDKYKLYLLTVILSTAVLISAIVFKPTIEGYFFAIILNSMVLIAVGLYLHRQNHKELLKGVMLGERELLVLGGAAIPAMLVSWFNGYVDRYTLSYFLDLEAVGYYSLAAVVGVGVGTTVVIAILKGSSVSMLQILQKNDKDKYLKLQKNMNIALIAIAVLATVSYSVIGEWLVISIFGDKYANSVAYILPLFLAVILYGAVHIYSTPLVQKKKLYIVVYIGIFAAIVNFSLNLLLITIIGIKGVIIAVFSANLVSLITVYFYAKKDFNYLTPPYWIITVVSILEILSLV